MLHLLFSFLLFGLGFRRTRAEQLLGPRIAGHLARVAFLGNHLELNGVDRSLVLVLPPASRTASLCSNFSVMKYDLLHSSFTFNTCKKNVQKKTTPDKY